MEMTEGEEEKSVGAFIVNSGGKFLLLYRADPVKSPWEPPKGHQEKGEADGKTLRRELMEECGISDLEIEGGFREEVRFVNSKGSKRLVVMYLAKYNGAIKLSEEHREYAWLSYEEAAERLDYHGFPAALEKAAKHLESIG